MKRTKAILTGAAIVIVLLAVIAGLLLWRNGQKQTVSEETDNKTEETVEDVQAPVFTSSDTLELEQGEVPDWNQLIVFEDDSGYELSVDDSSLDLSAPGEYTVTATAVDPAGNSTDTEIHIIVSGRQAEVVSDPNGGPDTVDGIVIVNKKHGLSEDYYPGEDPTAGEAVRQLIADMQAQGYDISNNYSGFRSYDTQSGLYWGYVASSSQEEADTYSARPGYSEHQTGLAFDLKHTSGALVTAEPEAQWLLENAWKYGFIVRYQEGWEDITGYMAEPWHLRYIGEKAEEITDSGLTLEEYLGVEGGDYIE